MTVSSAPNKPSSKASSNSPSASSASPLSTAEVVFRAVLILGILFVFLTGVQGLGTGFRNLGEDLLSQFFEATKNPFLGLVVGILGTTLVQSSSATTAMVVGMVGAGSLNVENAVPMVMGANIGTTVTNTMVSLGHVSRADEFRRAFAAATCHDFFNFIAVAVLLPLEIFTGFLRQTAGMIAEGLVGTGGGKMANPLKDATKTVVHAVDLGLGSLFEHHLARAVGLILVSGVLIFVALVFLVKVLRALTATRLEGFLTKALGKNAVVGILVGATVTVMVQSSSITTSVLIPLAGAGLVTLEAIFPCNRRGEHRHDGYSIVGLDGGHR